MVCYIDPDVTYGIKDPQQAKPVCWCEECGREIYSWDEAKQDTFGTYCEACYEELHPEDEYTMKVRWRSVAT